LIVGFLLKFLPCGKKDHSAQQVVPLPNSEINLTEDSYNKAIELKVEENKELFSMKR
jgi:hypothetical protein